MKKTYEFFFNSKSEALQRGKLLKQKLIQRFPETMIVIYYDGGYLLFEVTTSNIDAHLQVYPLMLEDEKIVGNLMYYVPLAAIYDGEGRLINLPLSGLHVGDLMNVEGRNILSEKHKVAFCFCKDVVDEHLSMLGLTYVGDKTLWNPQNRFEIADRYFPLDKVKVSGFDEVFAKYQYLFNYENYLASDNKLKKHFIPLEESMRHPWMKYLGCYIMGRYHISLFDKTHLVVQKIGRQNGYPFIKDPLTEEDYMVFMKIKGWRPENAEFLSRKYYPDFYKK